MTRGKIWLSWAAVFLSGVLLGGVATAYGFKRALARHLEGGPPAAKGLVLRVLRHELKLTPGQAAEVERIVARSQAEILAIRERNQPEIEAIIQRSVDEMKTGLAPEQRERLDVLHARARRHRAAAVASP
jgi:hypothetical protein